VNKKVCILTSVHTAKDVRIYKKQAISLQTAGYDVVILNKELDGIDETGITFKKVNISQDRFKRMLKSSNIMYKAAVKEKADIYHFHDPELLTCGKKLLKHGHVIYDSHEDVPKQILSKYWINPALRKIISKIFNMREKSISRKLTAIITATEKIADGFINNGCKKVITINNYPLLSEFNITSLPWSQKDNNICYVGGLTFIRGIIQVIDAMEKCNCRLYLAGSFENESIKDKAMNSCGWEKIDYLSQIDRNKVAEILSRSKAGIVTFLPEPNHIEAQPNKMFEYMAAGIPVIASNFPYWEKIIIGGNCGIVADPLDPDSISDAINKVIADDENAKLMGENGRKLVLEKYNWLLEEKKLLEIYKSFV
jgi:glycosyltransferase involved in cell wall biosynthesis